MSVVFKVDDFYFTLLFCIPWRRDASVILIRPLVGAAALPTFCMLSGQF